MTINIARIPRRAHWPAACRRVGSGTAVAVAILASCLWVRSYFAHDQLAVSLTNQSPSRTLFNRALICVVGADRGRLWLAIWHGTGLRLSSGLELQYCRSGVRGFGGAGVGFRPQWDVEFLGLEARREPSLVQPPDCLRMHVYGFGVPPPVPECTSDTFAIPFWLPLAGCALFLAGRRARRFLHRRRDLARRRQGLCVACGYDPRGRQFRCSAITRRARTVTVASAVVVIASLWVRAQFVSDVVRISASSAHLDVELCTMTGHLAVCIQHTWPSPLEPRLSASYDRERVETYYCHWYGGRHTREQRSPDFLGLQFCKFTPLPGDHETACETLAVPYWLPLAVCVAPFGLAKAKRLVRRRRQVDRERRGLCAVCGYDLRGSAGSCPECGSERGSAARGLPA